MNKQKLKSSWIDFMVTQGYTHALSLKPHRERRLPLEALHTIFCKLHMLIDKKLLGGRYNQPNRSNLRSQAVGIVEGLPDSGHLHGAFKVRPENWDKFEGLFRDGTTLANRQGIWRKLAPDGTCLVTPMRDPEGWYDYTFKDVWFTDDTDRILFLPLPVAPSAPRS
jgi:hypothetical protein